MTGRIVKRRLNLRKTRNLAYFVFVDRDSAHLDRNYMPATPIASLLKKAFREKRIEGFIASEGGPYVIFTENEKYVLKADEARAHLVDLLGEPALAGHGEK